MYFNAGVGREERKYHHKVDSLLGPLWHWAKREQRLRERDIVKGKVEMWSRFPLLCPCHCSLWSKLHPLSSVKPSQLPQIHTAMCLYNPWDFLTGSYLSFFFDSYLISVSHFSLSSVPSAIRHLLCAQRAVPWRYETNKIQPPNKLTL